MNQPSHSFFQDNSRNGLAALCLVRFGGGECYQCLCVCPCLLHTHTAHKHTHLKSQTETQALTLPSPGEEMKGRHSGKDGCEK